MGRGLGKLRQAAAGQGGERDSGGIIVVEESSALETWRAPRRCLNKIELYLRWLELESAMSDKDRYDRDPYRDRDPQREDRQKDHGNTPGRTEDTLPDRDAPPSKGR